MKFFPGCMIHNRYPGIEKSLFYVFEKLGIEIEPLEKSSCCPAPSITKSVSVELWEEIALRNIRLANNDTIITACNGCFTTLLEVSEKFNVGDIRHVAEFLYSEFGLKTLKKFIAKKLPLRVAVHYGCHFFRPGKNKKFTSSERPKMLDELVEILGSESINHRYKFMCCGGGGGVRAGAKDVALNLLNKKMEGITEADVDAIVVICPLCLNQFDVGQVELKKMGYDYNIPCVHYVQLLAIAMGMDVKLSGIEDHRIVEQKLIEKLVKGEEYETD